MVELDRQHDDNQAAGVLECVDGPYDAERTASAIDLLEGFPLPHGWTLNEALACPLTQEWHVPVLDWMLAQRIADAPTHATYLNRQAILVWSVYKRAPWSLRCRKGTAWGILIIGLRDHKFRPHDWVVADSILRPTEDFFENLESSNDLADLLHRVYRYTGDVAP